MAHGRQEFALGAARRLGLFLSLLEFGDVGVDRDSAAGFGLALADADPTAVLAQLEVWLVGVAVLCDALGNPFVDATLGIANQALFGGGPDDRLEW